MKRWFMRCAIVALCSFVVTILPYVRPAHVYTIIENPTNGRVYQYDTEYTPARPMVQPGLEGLYQGAVDNILYDGSPTILHSAYKGISQYSFTIFDAFQEGYAIHLNPPSMMGNDVIITGHIIGEKRRVGEQHVYDRLACCDKTNLGSLITMTQKQLDAYKEVPIYTNLVSAATYEAGYAIPAREHLDPMHLFGGPVKATSFDSFATESGYSRRYEEHLDKYKGYKDSSTWKQTADYTQHTCQRDYDNNVHVGARITHHHPVSSPTPARDVDDPKFMRVQPMDYYRLNHSDPWGPAQTIKKYHLYQYQGFREYISCLPGYREHIKDCMQKLGEYGFWGYVSRFAAGITYPGWGDYYGSFLYHVAEYIRPMYAEILACEAQEERIAQQKIVEAAWKKDQEAEQQKWDEQDRITRENASKESAQTATRDDLDKVHNVINTMKFMEQSGIDAEGFYNFSGDAAQNELHEKMGDYLLAHAHEVLLPDLSGYEITDPRRYIPNIVFQETFTAAFELNTAQLAYEAELMLGIAENVRHIIMFQNAFFDGIGDGAQKRWNDKSAWGLDLLSKATIAATSGRILALAKMTPLRHVIGPAIYLSSGVQRYQDWQKEWRKYACEVEKELACFNRGDLTALEQRYVDTYWERASSDFNAQYAGREFVDFAEAFVLGVATDKACSLAGSCPKVSEAVKSFRDMKQSVTSCTKKASQSVTQRAVQTSRWLQQKVAKQNCPQLALPGVPGVTIPLNEGLGGIAMFNESLQSTGNNALTPARGVEGSSVSVWDNAPSHVNTSKGFAQQRIRCVKDAQKECHNTQTLFKACHEVIDNDNNLPALIQEIKDVPEILRRVALKNGVVLKLEDPDLKHMGQRHVGDYWNGSLGQPDQTFLPRGTTIRKIAQTIHVLVEMCEDEIIENMLNKRKFQVSAAIDGERYKLGITNKNIKQVYIEKKYTDV